MASTMGFGTFETARGPLLKVQFDKMGQNLAEKAMMMMEAELRRTLEWMGVVIGAEADARTAHDLMGIASIQVKHFSFDNNPGENGFYFYHCKKLVHILYDPKFEQQKDRIHITINRGVVR